MFSYLEKMGIGLLRSGYYVEALFQLTVCYILDVGCLIALKQE